MITVVHVITKLEMGGAQENTLHTCRHLDRRRFRVALLHGPGGYYDDEARAMDQTHVELVPELVRLVDPRLDIACFARLKRRVGALLEEHEALGHDPAAFIVHTHSSKAGILGRLAARSAGAPRVVHTIHGFGFHDRQSVLKRAAFISAETLASRMTDAFISVSRASIAEGQALGIIGSAQSVHLIRSGFPLEEFEDAADRKPEIRRALGLRSEDDVIVCIANLKPQKDPLTLVEAVRLLLARRPRALLLYAGDGELRSRVEDAIRQADLEDHVRLLGWRSDIPALVGAADVVALSSIFEGLPRSAVQALAGRRPFVGTRVDGTAEIIRHGRNGYLVEPRSPERLAAALEKALVEKPVDPEDRARVKEWDATRMVEAQEALYEGLVAHPEVR